MSLTTLMDKIVQLSAQVRSKPEFRWGVVTGVSPLQVTLDADTAPLAGVPSTLVTGLAVGQRVQCAIQNHRVTVIGVANGGTPVGTILAYAGATAPSGFLLCDGQAVSRSTYASLFTVVGTTFGAGDGSTTFNLPDMRGRMPVGRDSADTNFNNLNTPTSYVGAKTHTLTATQLPNHQHSFIDGSHTFLWGLGGTGVVHNNQGVVAVGPPPSNNMMTLQNNWNKTSNDGGGGAAHNNMPPYRVLNFMIRF